MKRVFAYAMSVVVLAACTETSGPEARSALAVSSEGTNAVSTKTTGIKTVDLGILTGWPTEARAVNAARVIVGSGYTGANYSGQLHAVRWRETSLGSGVWTISDVSAFVTGSTRSAASGVNALGDLVGTMQNSAGANVSFTLTADNIFTEIDPPAGFNSIAAYGMNATRGVVGSTTLAPDPMGTTTRAFYYQSGALAVLPSLSGVSVATAINDNGTIAGYSYDALAARRAVQWSYIGGAWTITALPASTSSASESYIAAAVNSTGAFAGSGCPTVTTSGCTGPGPYLWTTATSAPMLLGSLGGTSGAATGINDAGDIAGWSYTNSGYQRAFFSTSGSNVLTVLNPLVGGGGYSYAFGVSGHLVVGQSSYPAPRMNTAHATLWIVP